MDRRRGKGELKPEPVIPEPHAAARRGGGSAADSSCIVVRVHVALVYSYNTPAHFRGTNMVPSIFSVSP